MALETYREGRGQERVAIQGQHVVGEVVPDAPRPIVVLLKATSRQHQIPVLTLPFNVNAWLKRRIGVGEMPVGIGLWWLEHRGRWLRAWKSISRLKLRVALLLWATKPRHISRCQWSLRNVMTGCSDLPTQVSTVSFLFHCFCLFHADFHLLLFLTEEYV